MVSLLAKNAVKIKCGFENAVMTGNYECAYACGLLSASEGLEKIEDYQSISELRNKILAQTNGAAGEDNNIKRIVQMLNDYEPSDCFDEQMKELYSEGYADKVI